MVSLVELTHRILTKHMDERTGFLEVALIGYCANIAAGEHLSRYLHASKHVSGLVLDCASASCYGSSIIRRNGGSMVVSVDRDEDLLQYGRKVFNAECILADVINLPFREKIFDSIVSLELL